jgi:hypothetical protein
MVVGNLGPTIIGGGKSGTDNYYWWELWDQRRLVVGNQGLTTPSDGKSGTGN